MESLHGFKNLYFADSANILYKSRRKKCVYLKEYDPQFFLELKNEILKKEKREHSIDTFCNFYKRNNPDKIVPSTKTVYEMIHNGKIEGIKPYMLPRLVKLKPRSKNNGHTNAKTSDNGSEFSKLVELENKNLKEYFAHPYSSYERGTNENTNGLIREFLPKGESMNGKEKEIPEIQKILNRRYRKILDYRSPEEYHFDDSIA